MNPNTPTAIFISYRQDDSRAESERLRSALCARWGEGVVFMDKKSILPGKRFDLSTRQALSTTSVVIAMIGPNWTTIKDEATGFPRLYSTNDWVREELAYALEHGIKIIPVFVRGAVVPNRGELPTVLGDLPLHQGVSLSNETLSADIQEIAFSIERLVVEAWGSKRLLVWFYIKSYVLNSLKMRSLLYLFAVFLGIILWFIAPYR